MLGVSFKAIIYENKQIYYLIFSPPVDVGGDVAEDEPVAETSSSPQSNGKSLHITDRARSVLSLPIAFRAYSIMAREYYIRPDFSDLALCSLI